MRFFPFQSLKSRFFSSLPPEKSLLEISEAAVQRLKQIGENGKPAILRISVEGGGCSGFQYKFSLEENFQKSEENDKVFTKDGCFVVTDKISLDFLKGSTIDFTKTLLKQSFRVQNPQAEYGCGCGSSFSIDLSKLEKK
eukprot:Sdes_comp18792_c0_seq3m9199